MTRMVAIAALAAGCWGGTAPTSATPPANAAPTWSKAKPAVTLVTAAEWEACSTGTISIEGIECDDQALEGGVPLRYRDLPAIATDGSVIAVVEERDGWGHIDPGIRLLDRTTGAPTAWFPLDGTGDVARGHIDAANAALAARTWVKLDKPTSIEHRDRQPGVFETTLAFGSVTAVYLRRNDGDTDLPPSEIRVVDKTGTVLVSRSDTETGWSAAPRCNLPRFQLVGVSASPGAIVFKTGLGMGGHNCDGVRQPPSWHVLAFP